MLRGWQEHGECARLAAKNPKLLDKVFFPHKGRPANNPEFKKYCGVCPVAEMCLNYALVHELDGVWGNTTRPQRELLLLIQPKLAEQLKQLAVNEGWYEPHIVNHVTHPIHLIDEPDYILEDDSVDPNTELLSQEDFVLEFQWVEYQQTIVHIAAVYEEQPEESLMEAPHPTFPHRT
jgi:hypothetical protein